MKLYVITLINQGVMIVKFTKLNITYAQEQKNIFVGTMKMPFAAILTTVVITAIFKIYSVSIMISLINISYQFDPNYHQSNIFCS